MPLADNIIILDAQGSLKTQGTWDTLRKCGVLTDDFLRSSSQNGSEQVKAAQDDTTSIPKPIAKILKGPSENDIADLQRQTGDLSLYGYYAATIGWKLSLSLVVAVILTSLAQFFPRGYNLSISLCCLLTLDQRSGLNGSQRESFKAQLSSL